MFPKTLAEHIEFHLELWAGLFRVAEELASWPQAIESDMLRGSMSYNDEKKNEDSERSAPCQS